MNSLENTIKIKLAQSHLQIDAETESYSLDNSLAYRIILQKTNLGAPVYGLFTDWDDTLEAYTERKHHYYQKLIHYLKLPGLDNKQVEQILNLINRHGRVLPYGCVHPEKYSPLLEMAADSVLIKKPLVSNFSKEHSDELIRSFLKNQIIYSFNLRVATTLEHKEYFVEKLPRDNWETDFLKKPKFILPQVWTLYKENMIKTNLHRNDLALFDLEDDIYWLISSFGGFHFQLNKIINGLCFLKQHGKRLPNEILLFVQGRKESLIKYLLMKKILPSIQYLFLDDSPNQLSTLKNFPNLTCKRALRPKSKRAAAATTDDFPIVNMEQTSLKKIIQEAFYK